MMSTSSNWLLRNGRLASGTEPVDLLIHGGIIQTTGRGLAREKKTRELDLEGRLVIPGFVDAHMHLDKAYALESGLKAGDSLDTAIRSFFEWARAMTPELLYKNARHVAEQAVLNGTIALRTHVTVDGRVGTAWLEPLAQLKREMAQVITIQLVAFLDASLFEGKNDVLDICRKAVDAGADVIGGAPWRVMEYKKPVDMLLDTAEAIGIDLDLHVDESDDPAINTLEYLAEQMLARHFPHRVTAGHCCSLSAKDEITAARIISKVVQARINVITLPSCNMFLMGRNDRGLVRRGLTRVRELAAAGVNVAYASDNIRDAFNPYGKADMLQEALITGHAIHAGSPSDFDMLLSMGTRNPARILGIVNHGLEPGCQASFSVLDDADWSGAVAREAARAFVFSHGRLVARTQVNQNLYMEDQL